MNKTLFIPLIIALIAILIASSGLYIINEKERAVLLRFGQIIKTDIQPGLHFKIPFVDTLRTFNGRLQTLELPSSRFLTQEKKAVLVDAYVKWRISSVERFYKSTSGDSFKANLLLSQRVESRLRDKIGSLTLTNVVSGQRDELMQEILNAVNTVAKKTLGIDVIDVRVRQIDLPSTVSEAVFSRMKSEREKEAREYRAQGKEAANIIQATADKERQIMLANAQQKADILRGQGDAEATRIYAKAYGIDSDFYTFYRSLSAYKKSFNSPSDLLLLDSSNPFFKFFNRDRTHLRDQKTP